MTTPYAELVRIARSVGLIRSIEDVLEWDRDVMMPPGDTARRAEQMKFLAKLKHGRLTHPRVGELLAAITPSDLSDDERVNAEDISRDYHHAVRVPATLEGAIAEAVGHSVAAWETARTENRFADFLPHLETVFTLVRERAIAMEPTADPYQTLMHEYEPGMTTERFSTLCGEYTADVRPLLREVVEHSHGIHARVKYLPERPIQKSQQATYLESMARRIGYDMQHGRVDVSAHPFSTSSGRITYSKKESWLLSIFSVLHEAGHAAYEHNLPREHFGTALGTYRSHGVHEALSRLWENNIGRSCAFWRGQLSYLARAYRPVLNGVSGQEFYRLINTVRPGCIRIDADELTYGFHVVLRYEIERGLFAGTVRPSDVPEVWNTRMRELLGVTPKTDTEGCLQDVHWCEGLFGYFPSYLYGSMLAAQLHRTLEHAVPNFEHALIRGDLSDIHAWLTENIYRHGRRYSTEELVRRATGKPPSMHAYTTYLSKKYRRLYGIR